MQACMEYMSAYGGRKKGCVSGQSSSQPCLTLAVLLRCDPSLLQSHSSKRLISFIAAIARLDYNFHSFQTFHTELLTPTFAFHLNSNNSYSFPIGCKGSSTGVKIDCRTSYQQRQHHINDDRLRNRDKAIDPAH